MRDDMPINVMLADIETFEITYANKRTFATLSRAGGPRWPLQDTRKL
jgi:hypothetical protein